jgi:mono/diheme cytochrome c family protein
MTHDRRGALLLTIVAVAIVLPVWAAGRQLKAPALVIPSMYGRDLYAFYCASCHGRDAKGDGPVAPVLKAAPPDLTRLAIVNGGVFPRARIEAIVGGRADPPLPVHGSREMPVWGPIFNGLDHNEAANRARIASIVGYLDSIQLRYSR